MKIAVLGTGMVGRALAGKLDELGHDVTVGTRDAEATLAREDFGAWRAQHEGVGVAAMADAAAEAGIVVLATAGSAAEQALQLAGAGNLAGKVVLDVTNPLDFSNGMPPSLSVVNTDSLAERLQRAFPEARVVKSLNTVNASVMVDPGSLAGGDHTIFVAGDDDGAKQQVRGLLEAFGWTDIVDLGDVTAARGLEMYLPLWLRLYGAFRSPAFSIKVVRG